MKKIFVLMAVIAALGFTGCPTDAGDNQNNSKTTLTINNQITAHTEELYDVKWAGTLFWNEGSTPYIDPSDSTTHYALEKSSQDSRPVSAGEGYIYFGLKIYYPIDELTWVDQVLSGRTQALISLENGKSETFTFLDSTVIVVHDKTGTLSTIGDVLFGDQTP